MTGKVASAGVLGNTLPRPDVSVQPLSDAKSQMRACIQEVIAWIWECKAWNAECKLARAKNIQSRTRMGNHSWGAGTNRDR